MITDDFGREFCDLKDIESEHFGRWRVPKVMESSPCISDCSPLVYDNLR